MREQRFGESLCACGALDEALAEVSQQALATLAGNVVGLQDGVGAACVGDLDEGVDRGAHSDSVRNRKVERYSATVPIARQCTTSPEARLVAPLAARITKPPESVTVEVM